MSRSHLKEILEIIMNFNFDERRFNKYFNRGRLGDQFICVEDS